MPSASHQIVTQCLLPQLPSHGKLKHQIGQTGKATGQPRPLGLHIGACGPCVCSDTRSTHHPLGPASDGICFLLFIFSLGSHLLVFIFHLWMDKVFLHVSAFWNRFLIIYFQLFNVNIWAATKSADKCIMFPIVCHNICFFVCETFWGCGLSHIHILKAVLEFLPTTWPVFEKLRKRVWSLCSHWLWGWVLEYAPIFLDKLCRWQKWRWGWQEWRWRPPVGP